MNSSYEKARIFYFFFFLNQTKQTQANKNLNATKARKGNFSLKMQINETFFSFSIFFSRKATSLISFQWHKAPKWIWRNRNTEYTTWWKHTKFSNHSTKASKSKEKTNPARAMWSKLCETSKDCKQGGSEKKPLGKTIQNTSNNHWTSGWTNLNSAGRTSKQAS